MNSFLYSLVFFSSVFHCHTFKVIAAKKIMEGNI